MSLSSLVNGSVATTIIGSEPASSQESYQDLRHDLTSLNPSQTSISPDAPSVNRLDSCPSSSSSCWRESEVKRILQGHDLESIQLVCRFNPFEDEAFAESLLREHSRLRLATVPRRPRTSSEAASGMTPDREVREILKQCKTPLVSADMRWEWMPFKAMDKTNTDQIATNIANESWSKFQQVPFEDWIRQARGLSTNVLYDFLFQYNLLSLRLFHYLGRHPEEMEKYQCVEKALRERDPFVHSAVSNSIQLHQSTSIGGYSEPILEIDFIVEPLQELLETQDRPVTDILQQLAVLAVRFQRDYQWEEEIDWTQKFRTDTEFFRCIRGTSPSQLADSISECDLKAFRNLGPQSIIYQDDQLKSLALRWNRLSQEVLECVVASRQLGHKIADLAAELHIRQNFYSMTAVLQGLREAGFDKPTVSKLNKYIDPDQNYLGKAPAIPFLFPHIRQFQMHRERIFPVVFIFMLYGKEEPPPSRVMVNMGGSGICAALRSCFGFE